MVWHGYSTWYSTWHSTGISHHSRLLRCKAKSSCEKTAERADETRRVLLTLRHSRALRSRLGFRTIDPRSDGDATIDANHWPLPFALFSRESTGTPRGNDRPLPAFPALPTTRYDHVTATSLPHRGKFENLREANNHRNSKREHRSRRSTR